MVGIYQRKINKWYSNISSSKYDPWMFRDTPKGSKEKLMNYLDFKKNDCIIELGCGTGQNIRYFPESLNLHLLDINKNMLNSARNKSKDQNVKINFYQEDAKNTSFQDSFFNKGILTFALSGIPENQLVLKEMSRIVVQNGLIGILDFSSIRSNFVGGITGINSLDDLINQSFLRTIKKETFVIVHDELEFDYTGYRVYLLENKK